MEICTNRAWVLIPCQANLTCKVVAEGNVSMKDTIRIAVYSLLLMVALFCLVPAALAGDVSMALNDPPSNNILDNVYVGPYNATNTTTGGSMQVICDDFRDESNYNNYTYTQTSFTNLSSSLGSTLWGSVLLGQGYSSNYIIGLYDQAAWLATGMMNLSSTQQAYYAFALWAVFDPTDVLNYLRNAGDTSACNAIFGGHQNCSSSSTVMAGGILYAAQQNYMNGDYSNLVLLTPIGCSPTGCQEQEFFEFVPEGGSALLYLMLAGIACLGAVWQSRRGTGMIQPA
jgi:hypothetical protein